MMSQEDAQISMQSCTGLWACRTRVRAKSQGLDSEAGLRGVSGCGVPRCQPTSDFQKSHEGDFKQEKIKKPAGKYYLFSFQHLRIFHRKNELIVGENNIINQVIFLL